MSGMGQELETSNSYNHCVQNISQINFGVTGGRAPVSACVVPIE